MMRPDRERWAGLWASRRDATFDVLLVCAVEAVLLVLLWPLAMVHGLFGLAFQSAFVATLLLRRVAPLTVLFLGLASTIALAVIGRHSPDLLASTLDPKGAWVALAMPFTAYSGVVYGTDRRRAWLMIGIIAVIAARPFAPSADVAVGAGIVALLPGLLGSYVAGLNERVERAEREQVRAAERARVEERVRLAAEMHDVVTHRVSLMVLQAGALGVTASDAATRAAAEDLRSAGCQALEELRDLVGVLREAPPGEVAEPGGLTRAGGEAGSPDLEELLAESESVGVTARLERSGNPDLASPVVARTAYRVAQEALTNVRKHAPGAHAVVRLAYQSDRVRLTVRNSAPEGPADPGLTGSGSGTGLLGLRHRVELVSGSFRAGPTADGGFEVEAVLPAYVPTREEPVGRAATPAGKITTGKARAATGWAPLIRGWERR
jgi:signal transduction histidine kinase